MAQQYQINISIDQQGTQQINQAGQYVTFVKSVASNPAVSGNLAVAWLTFSPFQNNIVTWYETYYMYASATVVQSGATIMLTSPSNGPVTTGPIYTFQNNVFTTGSQGSPTTYNLNNQNGSSPTLSFGLAQMASVNGSNTSLSPLNAVTVLNNQNASFTPIETISIFLSSYDNNGVVISQVAGNALTVQLTSQQPVANVGFNDANNTFVLNSLGSSYSSFAQVALGLPAPQQQFQQHLQQRQRQ